MECWCQSYRNYIVSNRKQKRYHSLFDKTRLNCNNVYHWCSKPHWLLHIQWKLNYGKLTSDLINIPPCTPCNVSRQVHPKCSRCPTFDIIPQPHSTPSLSSLCFLGSQPEIDGRIAGWWLLRARAKQAGNTMPQKMFLEELWINQCVWLGRHLSGYQHKLSNIGFPTQESNTA